MKGFFYNIPKDVEEIFNKGYHKLTPQTVKILAAWWNTRIDELEKSNKR